MSLLKQCILAARAPLMRAFAYLESGAFRPWRNNTDKSERLTHNSGFSVPKRLSRYAVSVLFAVLLHALLLVFWSVYHQSIQLRLPEGHQTVSLKLAKTGPNRAPEMASPKIVVSPKIVASPKIAQAEALPLPSATDGAAALTHTEPGPVLSHREHTTSQATFSRPKSVPVKSRKVLPINTPHPFVEPNNNEVESPKAEAVVGSRTQSGNEPIEDIKAQASDAGAVENKPDPPPADSLVDVETKQKGTLARAQPLSNNSPKYPRRAIMRNQQGRVKVSLSVDKSGHVNHVEVIESSGYSLLDNSVLRFVEHERFVPAMRDGEAIASTQLFLFRFLLE